MSPVGVSFNSFYDPSAPLGVAFVPQCARNLNSCNAIISEKYSQRRLLEFIIRLS